MNGCEQLYSNLIHVRRHSVGSKGRIWLEEVLMNKTKLTFVTAVLCGGLLALAPMSGATAAPVAPIGKAATENDFRSPIYYGYYHHRRYHHRYYHHRHCWWRHGHRHCRW
jgi:hypothetical protein